MHTTRRHAQFVILAAMLLLAAGCATLGPSTQPASPAAEAGYGHAQQLYDAGNYKAAAPAFLAVAGTDPAIHDRATLAAAASYRSLGQIDKVASLLPKVRRGNLAPNEDARYRVLSGEVALHRGDAGAALQLVSNLPTPLPKDIQQHALDVEARAHLAKGDRPAAARALVQRAPLLAQAARSADIQQAVAVLAGMGNEALNAFYAQLADNDPVKPYARQALSQAGANVPQALPQLNEPVGTYTGAALPQGFAMPTKVALLLPSSGPVAVAAAAVRDGFFTAYFHTPVTREQRPSIKVYDTDGTADGAVAAYQKAVADGAVLAVGPLGRAAVGAVFAQSSLPIPVLALNRPQGNLPTPGGSAEFALLPEAEGAQLAAHMITLGLHAAIVFRGDDSTAARTFDAFRTQFASLGGQVANDVVLPAGSVDYSSQITAALAGSGSETGIVVLLRPTAARLLLPQLRLAQSTLPMFATSMVYSGNEDPTADTDLDGLRFCDEPWLYDAQTGLPDRATLASQLDTAAGPAGRLFAFGMDAYALMPYLGWLRSHPGSYLAGATGQLTMNTFGEIQRVPVWVQFQGGVPRPVAAGLEMQPEPLAPPTGP